MVAVSVAVMSWGLLLPSQRSCHHGHYPSRSHTLRGSAPGLQSKIRHLTPQNQARGLVHLQMTGKRLQLLNACHPSVRGRNLTCLRWASHHQQNSNWGTNRGGSSWERIQAFRLWVKRTEFQGGELWESISSCRHNRHSYETKSQSIGASPREVSMTGL